MILPSPKTKQKSKQVGRGIGTGKGGHTTGRGMNGQKSRSGYTRPGPAFEGGQNPLSRRLPKLKGDPKKGKAPKRENFTSKIQRVPVKLSVLSKAVKAGDVVNFEKLIELKLVKNRTSKAVVAKILFDTDIDKKITIENLKVSEKVKASIEKAGGEVK